jgi:hypothetical protein
VRKHLLISYATQKIKFHLATIIWLKTIVRLRAPKEYNSDFSEIKLPCLTLPKVPESYNHFNKKQAKNRNLIRDIFTPSDF